MDVEFRTRKLRRCFESSKEAACRWGAEVARRYVQRVTTLYDCESIDDLYKIPSFNFHPLKGNRDGQYAIDLNGQIRLIVCFPVGAKNTVRVEEVSKHYGD